MHDQVAHAAEAEVNVAPDVIRIGTLNVRNTADRWSERAELLVEQLVALRPDVIGLQEIRRPARQARWITARVNARIPPERPNYAAFATYKTGVRRWWEGLALLSRFPALGQEWLDLAGGNRVAQRVRVSTPDGGTLEVYNVHLHHAAGAEQLRLAQVERVLDWMGRAPDLPQVLVGDFNSDPDSPAIRRITERLRSAYAAIHGTEPELTAPTALSPHFGQHAVTIDFIFVNERVALHDARLAFDQPHAADDRLFPSDHFGLLATISI
jgi:endonuclease/exonuclease/phosphatase family metal-dependent hydrolase